MDGTSQRDLELASVAEGEELAVEVARHRRHRFPARTESVRARYDREELAVVAAAAARAGMTPSGYVAATALAVAENSRLPDASGDRELLAQLLQARLAVRRYAVNVNQAVAALHSTGDAPVWLSRAVAGAHQAVLSADAATRRVTGRHG